MKKCFLLSALTAIVILAATTTADAGIFGRLSTVWNGCNPCLPVACDPCAPVACDPCAPAWCGPLLNRPLFNFRPFTLACDPCGPIVDCDPCLPAWDGCSPCGPFVGPFRPFGGFFANLGARIATRRCATDLCDPCGPVACGPCEPVACDPCGPVACGPGAGLPFNGFFLNLRSRLASRVACAPDWCDPCGPVVCDPCGPTNCDPCAPRVFGFFR